MLEISIETNAMQVLADMGKDIDKMIAKTKEFTSKMKDKYRTDAKSIVAEVVYNAYSPQVYRRTHKLLNSIKAEVIEGGFGIAIYQDSSMTPLKGSGRYPGYGHYFIDPKGSFLARETMPQELVESLPRDFLAIWESFFSVVIDRDYLNVMKRI